MIKGFYTTGMGREVLLGIYDEHLVLSVGDKLSKIHLKNIVILGNGQRNYREILDIELQDFLFEDQFDRRWEVRGLPINDYLELIRIIKEYQLLQRIRKVLHVEKISQIGQSPDDLEYFGPQE